MAAFCHRLYWTDTKLKQIEFANLDGKERKPLLTLTDSHLYDVTVFQVVLAKPAIKLMVTCMHLFSTLLAEVRANPSVQETQCDANDNTPCVP